MYVFPLSLESKDLVSFGLKFRDLQLEKDSTKSVVVVKKLELKFRKEKKDSGAEKWDKGIIENLPKELVLLKQLGEKEESKGELVQYKGNSYHLNFTELVGAI